MEQLSALVEPNFALLAVRAMQWAVIRVCPQRSGLAAWGEGMCRGQPRRLLAILSRPMLAAGFAAVRQLVVQRLRLQPALSKR